MLIKKVTRCLAALSLAAAVLLCSGCGSSGAPSAPSQSPAAASPTTELPPEPTAASSPTDVNAPVRPLAPDISIERETPDYLHFIVSAVPFTLTNAEENTLSFDGTQAGGTMEFAEEQLSGAGGSLFSAQIPYSSRFVCELSGSAQSGEDWGLEIVGTGSAYKWCHCVVRGSGKTRSVEYNTAGQLIVRSESGSELELTVPMPDSVLGENGWVRLSLTAAEEEVCLTADGSILSFSGLSSDSAAPASLDCGGFISRQGQALELSSGSGTLDISNIADGNITVKASGD